MGPAYKMPEPARCYRDATLSEINNALCAARCAAEVAGMETGDFVVRELLLTVLQQIDRAAAAVRRLS